MPKRRRLSQPEASVTPNASATSPPAKRTRVASPAIATSEAAIPAKPTSSKSAKKAPVPSSLLQPKKRKSIPGRLNRLAVPKPISLAAKRTGSGSTRPDINRRGNKINKGWGTGGFDAGAPLNGDEDLGEAIEAGGDPKGKGKAVEQDKAPSKKSEAKNVAELWYTRKTSFSSYLRAGKAAFVDKGHHTLVLRALGAAVPDCMSLVMAIRDALPCGKEGCSLEVRTGSVDVNDEIVPEDDSDGEDQDIQYQVRTKTSIELVLKLKKDVRNRLLIKSSGVNVSRTLGAKEMGVRPGRGGRGRPIRGGSRGGRPGRGRS